MLKKPRILVCDDDALVHNALKLALGEKYEVTVCQNGDQAIEQVKTHTFDVVILDIQIRTKNEGLRYIPLLKKADMELAIIMSSGITDFDSVREALKQGADDFVPKDSSPLELTLSLERVLELRKSRIRNEQQNSEVATYHNHHVMIGESKISQQLRRTIQKARLSNANVLITGEPGVGKEVVARLLRGTLPDGSLAPFVAVDSSTIQSSTAESTLFGHEKGSFTGADKTKKGLFEEAEGGIIYFDEIGNMPMDIQPKLLRVVQEKEIVRMGSSRVIGLDFRVIGATNRALEKMVEEKEFRFDLLSRLSVIPIHVPPLRERREDIPLLFEYFLKKHAVSGKRHSFSHDAMALLMCYHWPGNVRELSSLVAYSIAMSDTQTIDISDLPAKIIEAEISPRATSALPESSAGNFYDSVKVFEKAFLQRSLARVGNIAQLARELGMNRSHLHAKLKEYGIHSEK